MSNLTQCSQAAHIQRVVEMGDSWRGDRVGESTKNASFLLWMCHVLSGVAAEGALGDRAHTPTQTNT